MCLAAVAPPLRAQTPGAAMPINPDRPDLTNSPQLVAPGIVQIETGVVQKRQDAGDHDFSSPIAARIGVRNWLEAQVGSDGLEIETRMGERATGSNVKVGAKVRLLRDSTQQGLLSILPQVQHGADNWDYALTVMAGTNLGPWARIDTNYTIGAIGYTVDPIGTDGGHRHFAQHSVSASLSVSQSGPWSAYFEAFANSGEDAGARAVTGIDTGVMYAIRTRMAVDGGIGKGISGDASPFSAFGGFSVALGHAHAGGADAHAHTRLHSPTSASAGQDRGSDPRR